MSFDLKIVNGVVVDGSGGVCRGGGVGVRGGRVVEVGEVSGRATRTIDAGGCVVAPGIVDGHTHYDPQITFDPWATSSCYQGVTTVVAGNCGYSLAPCRGEDREFLSRLFARVEGIEAAALAAVRWEFESFPEFFASLDGRLGVNFGCYVGHSSVRRWVMGVEASERVASDGEIASMGQVVREAMAAGAAGFSSSRGPSQLDGDGRLVPSRHGSDDELKALVAAAGVSGRGTVAYLPEAVTAGAFASQERRLLIDLALAGGVPLVIQGLGGRSKVDAPSADSWQEAQEFLRDAAAQGAAIFSLLRSQPFDRPFSPGSSTPLYAGVPEWHWFMNLSRDDKLAALRGTELRARLEAAPANTDPRNGSTTPAPPWSNVRVTRVSSAVNQHLVGMTMEAVAASRGVSPTVAMLDLALEEDLDVDLRYVTERPEWFDAVAEVQHHPNMIMGISDGGAHLDRDDSSEWSSYFLRTWVLDRELWSLEDGIRQITHVPAALLGLTDRGLLAPGYAADIFIFDPDTIAPARKERVWDLPGGHPRYSARPEGIHWTIVNGEPIVEHGTLTNTLPGTIVKPAPATT